MDRPEPSNHRPTGDGVTRTFKPRTDNEPARIRLLPGRRHDPNETHTLSVLVQNEPGVLARVIGLFSGRGYNIESLTVSETESQKHLSRITIVTTGTPMVIEQIKHQLDRMVPVHRVVDMTITGRSGAGARHGESRAAGATTASRPCGWPRSSAPG